MGRPLNLQLNSGLKSNRGYYMLHTHTHIQMISDNDHWTSASAVHIVQLVFMAYSRTERLRLPLTASYSCHCIALMHLIQPSLMFVGFPRNKRLPHLVGTRNMVAIITCRVTVVTDTLTQQSHVLDKMYAPVFYNDC